MTEQAKLPRVTTAEEFLKVVRPNGPWVVASLDPNVDGATPKFASFKGAADLAKAGLWTGERNGKVNLYFMPNPTRRPVTSKPREAQTARVDWAFVECDPKDGEQAADARARHRKALQSPPDGLLPPTVIWDTGNGVAAMWKLVSPIVIESQTDIDCAKAINKGIAQTLGGRAEGYDACQNLDRLLRLPFTTNIPDARKRAKGRKVEEAGNVEYHPFRVSADFELPSAEITTNAALKEIGEATQVDLEDLPDDLAEAVQADVPVGQRSDHAFDVIRRLLNLGWSRESILGVLMNPDFAIHDRIQEKGGERFAREEIKRTAAKVARIDPADEFNDPVDSEVAAEAQAKSSKYKPRKISELMALPSPKWLIKDVLIEGGLFEVYGRFKSGKTFWAVEMACCIATGHDFFDAPVERGRVVYVIAEGSRKLFGYRVSEWAKERSEGDAAKLARLIDAIEENLDVVPVAVPIDVDAEVKAFMKANPGKRAAVFIDTLFRSMQGDVMKSGDMVKFIAGCDRIRHKLDAAVIFLHHQKRNDAKGGFGSIVGEASVDGAAKVSSPRARQSVFRIELMRDGDANAKPWAAEIQPRSIDGTSDGDVDSTGVLVFQGRGVSRAEDLLQLIADHGPSNIPELVTISGRPQRTVEDQVAKLRKRGLLAAKGLKVTPAGREHVSDSTGDGDDYGDEQFE